MSFLFKFKRKKNKEDDSSRPRTSTQNITKVEEPEPTTPAVTWQVAVPATEIGQDDSLQVSLDGTFDIVQQFELSPASEPTAASSLADAAKSSATLIRQKASSKSLEEACEVSGKLLAIVKDISEVTDLLSPLRAASALMIRGIDAIKNVLANTTAWSDLCDDLIPHVSQMEKWGTQLEGKVDGANRSCLESLKQYLEIAAEIVQEAAEYGIQRNSAVGNLKRAATSQTEKEEIIRQRQRVKNAWQAVIAAMTMDVLQGVDRIERHLRESELSMSLTSSWIPKTVYGIKVDVCEEGTRKEILAVIREWAEDLHTERQIFWLNDAAGTGKSTVAATVAKEWQNRSMLAGRFFFSPNDVAERTTDNFCLMVAEDIVVNQPAISGLVRQAIKATPRDHFSFVQQFEKLIIDPLRKYAGAHAVCIVIDALDNCDDRQERKQLLQSLKQFLPSVKSLKVFLTSRPFQDISDELKECPLVYGAVQLFDAQKPGYHDIAIYVNKKLESNPKVSDLDRRTITERSGGLFLYAATICRMLENEHRRHIPALLKSLTTREPHNILERQMDELYISVLKYACIGNNADAALMDVLSIVVIAFQPVSINTIRAYLPGNDQVDDIIHDLGAVLKSGGADQPIKVLHPTFREFLLSRKETVGSFSVETRTSHMKLAYGCMKHMEQSLRYNILGIEGLGCLPLFKEGFVGLDQRLQKTVSPATNYAIAFWVHHVECSEPSRPLWDVVLNFLGGKLLNWIEVMSWKGSLVSCIDSLSRLRIQAKKIWSEGQDILTKDDLLVIREAHQFVVQHQWFITESPLQVYSVALFFTPPRSPIFRHYRALHYSQQPKIIAPYATEWGSHILLGSHIGTVNDLVFSSDGNRLMSSGSTRVPSAEGYELLLWNTETGALVRTLFKGHEIESYTFSLDGQYLAFSVRILVSSVVPVKSQVQVHFSSNGELINLPSPIEGEITNGKGIPHCFSATHPHISSVLYGRIDLHNLETRQLIRGTDFKNTPTNRLVFSSNGKKMASISTDADGAQVAIWDWDISQLIATIPTKRNPTGAVFSADGARLAVSLTDRADAWEARKSVQVWSVSTKIGLTKTIEIPEPYQRTTLFSPFGTYLALYSKAVHVWNCESKGCIFNQPGQYEYATFSSAEDRLATFATDLSSGTWTVGVWSLPSGEALASIIPDYMTKGAYKFALSADWAKLVTVTAGNQLQIYNLQEVDHSIIPRKVKNTRLYTQVTKIGTLIASMESTSATKEIQLWNLTTGKELGSNFQIDSDMESDSHLSFSPNGRLIAANMVNRKADGQCISRVYIWNIRTNKLQGNPLDITTCVSRPLIFSPDSKLLAAYTEAPSTTQPGSYVSLYVWNVHSRELVWQCSYEKRHLGLYSALLVFSPDSSQILAFDGVHLSITHLSSNTRIIGNKKSFSYDDGSFSPTQALVALVGVYGRGTDGVLEIWRVGESLEHVETIWRGKVGIYPFRFSNGGQYLAYGRLFWEIGTSIQPYTGVAPPDSFDRSTTQPYSFFTYKDGWIHSEFPPAPLLPVPSHFRGEFLRSPWFSCGNCVIMPWSNQGPLAIDCSPYLAQLRAGTQQKQIQ
ncbi:hypothetical protein FRB91_001776 [Serendipita sp. 411]|nr:hypothetical protein FRB91_001776 [Serendipita sp. 411]